MLKPHLVANRLCRLAPRACSYWVGFSGGRDSTALLHCLAQQRGLLPAPLAAIHVDHGLHSDSANWAQHCKELCARLEIPLTIRTVCVEQQSGAGLEAAARRARYSAFATALQPNECLVLAHHADDQAETLLLRALRGGGVNTLSAIPPRRALERACIARPLLEYSCAQIDAYISSTGLTWIDDPANAETTYDRVYIRRNVLPELKQRWPDTATRLSNSASAANRDRQLLNHYLDVDLRDIRYPGGRPSVSALARLGEQRRLAVLRRWLECSGVRPPPHQQLINDLKELLDANPSATPMIEWTDALLRRYRDRLYLSPRFHRQAQPHTHPQPLHNAPGSSVARVSATSTGGTWHWRGEAPLKLPDGTLDAKLSPDNGLDPRYRGTDLEVRWPYPAPPLDAYRSTPPDGAGNDARRRKRLYQELGVPPWERTSRPLIYTAGKPVAVAGYGAGRRYSNRPGLRLIWLK